MWQQLIARIRQVFSNQQLSTYQNPAQWFLDWANGPESSSGIAINATSLLSYAPIYYGVTRISGHIGSMPLLLKQRTRAGDVRLVSDREQGGLGRLVGSMPNELMGAQDFREAVQANALLWGNGKAVIMRSTTNLPIDLIPLIPERTFSVREYDDDGLEELWHVTTTEDGKTHYFPDRDILHIKNLSRDGLEGLSLVKLAANSVGSGLAGEQLTNNTFRSGAMPSIVLEAPEGKLVNDQKAQEYIDQFNRRHAGLTNAGKAGLLRDGIKATTLSMPPSDAQLLEQRRFAREEAALWTSIEWMLGIDKSMAYNQVQQLMSAYFTNCLSRWVVKWQQELDRKLLTPGQRSAGYHFDFDEFRLLAGSTKERWESYEIARRSGLLSQEEIRKREGLNEPETDDTFELLYKGAAVEPAEPVNQPAQDETTTNRLRRAMVWDADHVRKLARRGPRDFLKRVADHYLLSGQKFRKIIQDVGGSKEIADDVHHTSHNMILHACGELQCDDLYAGIVELTNDWGTDRVDAIANAIREEQDERAALVR